MNCVKVLLIDPPVTDLIRTELPLSINKNLGHTCNLGLLYILSALRKTDKSISANFLDCRTFKAEYPRVALEVKKHNPDIVGIFSVTHNIISVLNLAGAIKEILPNTHINLGGPHPTLFPKQSLKYPGVDSITVGDGERSFPDLALNFKNPRSHSAKGIYFKDSDSERFYPDFIDNLDELDYPARDLILNKRYNYRLSRRRRVATMVSSRGCPHFCTFCLVPNIKYRKRSVGSVLSEIDQCLKMGFEEIYFVDDTFNSDINWLRDFISEIKKRNILWSCRARVDGLNDDLVKEMKSSHCIRIHFGVETSTDEGLKILGKDTTIDTIKRVFSFCRKHRVETVGYFLVGSPAEKTKQDILKTIDFAVRLNPDYAMFNILALYPKTGLYRRALEKNIITNSLWEGFIENPYRDFELPFWQEYFSRKQLYGFLKYAYFNFYLRPSGIKNIVKILK
ncbi:MAG: radical SAM protein [Candidatus Omnitrophica bacterium]|nr:radical SAM protein [Candidatus Omnitrophota bacterium]